MSEQSEQLTGREKKITMATLAGIAVFFLIGLGSIGFWDPDEGRYASIPAAMVRTGDWLTPRLCGVPYFEKPPLLYWVTALSFKLLGFSEFAGRLPLAVCGFVGVCAIFWLGWRKLDWETGLLAAVVLAVNPEYFISARFLVTDMILAGCLTLAMVGFYCASTSTPTRGYATFYVFVALSVLSKGLIGFLLPALIVGAYVLLTRQWHLLREMKLWRGVLIFVIIVFPWFIAEQRRYPEFLNFFIVEHHLVRFTTARTSHHPQPIYFFLPVLLAGFFPWSFLLPVTARRLIPRSDAERQLNVFLWLWFSVIFIFFSMSRGKLTSYVLPAFPPIALLVAQLLNRLGKDVPIVRGVRWGTVLVALFMVILALAILTFAPSVERRHIPLDALRGTVVALSGGMTLGGILLLFWQRLFSERQRFLVPLLVGTNVWLLLAVVNGAKAIEPYANLKPIALAVAQRSRPDDKIVLYNVIQHSLEFYTQRPPIVFSTSGNWKEWAFGLQLEPNAEGFRSNPDDLQTLLASPETVYVIAHEKAFPQLQRSLRVPVYVVRKNASRVVFCNRPVDVISP
jgi:4-amino-4-deoxy-L-arabinose transferase-like glycosyltransferase